MFVCLILVVEPTLEKINKENFWITVQVVSALTYTLEKYVDRKVHIVFAYCQCELNNL